MNRLFCTLLLILSLMTGTAFAADFSNLVILHTNDTHGYDLYSEEDGVNGMAVVSELRKQYMSQGKNVLLLDGGDAVHDNNLVNFSQGASAIQFMNAVGYEAMCLGNHEFSYGQDVILERIHEADFPVLACNIIVEATGKLFTKPSVILKKGSDKIGIVGITTPETATGSNPKAVAGLRFLRGEELYAAVQREVDSLKRQDCDLIVALGHLGSEDINIGSRSEDVLKNVTGIDIFIDGHDHQVKDTYINGTLLAETGCYTHNIGQIVYRDGKWQEDLLPFEKNRVADKKVSKLINRTAKEVNAKLAEPIGTLPFLLDGSRDPGVRNMEMNIGDFVTDAFLWQANQALAVDGVKVDAAIINGGSIRSSIPVGKVTVGDIVQVLPYNEMLYVVTLKGKDLLEVLEASTFDAPNAIGGFPQVAGIKYILDTRVPYESGHIYPGNTYAAPKNPGARVTITEVGGAPFDPDKAYHLVVDGFIMRGGETYGHLAEPGVIDAVCIGYVDKDAVQNYWKEALNGTVPEEYRNAQGRITMVK